MTLHVRMLDSDHDDLFGRGLQSFRFGSPATAQRLECRLKVILGEYFLDTSDGVPWFQQGGSEVPGILGTMPGNPAYAASVLKARILSTDGIASIKTFDLQTASDRSITVTVTGTDDDGADFSASATSP